MDPYRQQNPYGIPPPSNNGYGAPPPTYQPGYAPPPPGYPGYSGQPGYGGAVPPPPPMGIAGVAPGYGAAPSAYGQPQGPKPAAPRPNNMSGYNTAPGYDAEAAQAASYASAFIEKKVRSAFVRKVFILVFLQLCVTIGIAAVFLFVNPVNEYVAGPKYTYTKSDGTEGTYRGPAPGAWVFYASWGLTLVMLIVLMCFTSVRRKYPWNYLAMGFFVTVMSVQVGCIVAWWSLSVVLEAVAVTGAAVLGLTLAAIFIPWDLTKRGHILAMAGLIVFFVALMTIIIGFFYVSKWWYLALSCVFAILFSAYLIYDIQMVLGGKTFSVSPDEYVFASVQIYLDIVLLFLQILNIIGIASS